MLGERMNIDKKIAIVAVLAAVAVIAGYVIVTYAQETSNTTSTVTPTTPGAWIPLKGYGGFSSDVGSYWLMSLPHLFSPALVLGLHHP
ncbi:MAG: hypothetical protein QXW41_09025 [Fervidicoccaceae archaeon]